MVKRLAAGAIFALGLTMGLILGFSVPVHADSASECSGFRISDCLFVAGDASWPGMWHLSFAHSSNRAVFLVKDRFLSSAGRLGFSFQNYESFDASACSGFRITRCFFVPGGSGWPDVWYFDIAHSSNQHVFRVKDRSWSSPPRLGVTLAK